MLRLAFAPVPAVLLLAALSGAAAAAGETAPPGHGTAGDAQVAQGVPAQTGDTDTGAGPAATPTAVVDGLHASLLAVMRQADELGFEGRCAVLAPTVEGAYDLPALARAALGRHWRGLDPAQRERFLEAFTQFSIATYASRFDAYSGERFETLSEQPLDGGQALVRTRLLTGGGESVALDYVLLQRDGTWGIVNVIADGVSELATRRAEYSSLMRDSGFEALVGAIEARTRDYGLARS